MKTLMLLQVSNG